MSIDKSHQQTGKIKVDLREVAAAERRSRVFSAYAALQPGEALELTHFHHSTPLHYLLLAEAPRDFVWKYLEQGPTVWRILISKCAKNDYETAFEQQPQVFLRSNPLHRQQTGKMN